VSSRIEQLASPRILAGQPGDIFVYPYVNGALLTGTPTSLTVAVTDEAGASVVASTTATWDATNKRLTFTLSAAQNPRPRVLLATWGFTAHASDGGATYSLSTVHEAVGELLFTEAEARVYDNSALTSTATYPTDTLLRMRDQVHDAFEDIIGVGIGARGVREVCDGDGTQRLDLRRQPLLRVRAVSERQSGTQTWTAYDASALADILLLGDGSLWRETLGGFTWGRQNVAVEYEHGLSPIPLDLRRAALRLTRNLLVPSNLSDRALAETNQLGTFRMAVAGLRDGAWFGIPPVDSVLQFYRDRFNVPTVR
jgi:hypothetical protein